MCEVVHPPAAKYLFHCKSSCQSVTFRKQLAKSQQNKFAITAEHRHCEGTLHPCSQSRQRLLGEREVWGSNPVLVRATPQITNLLMTCIQIKREYAHININPMFSRRYPKIHPRKLQWPIRTNTSKAVIVVWSKRNILFPLRRTTVGQVLNICTITEEEKWAQEVTFHKQLELHSELKLVIYGNICYILQHKERAVDVTGTCCETAKY